ncbi:type II toxin-antitoxin system VapC family toxin [Conexibacter arvalis]|uniref:Ribonuclease VapC n=1 Tax=Conexibacter arvalis TaxID=912552 RepID=A0A840ILG9_9ACTN|nr:type II toxin-antitoxin system VapC family toxin [Conexibacter arvalis]MBB4665091.1 putative nucleic acid-binding protein [Conexibacter arvalis]
MTDIVIDASMALALVLREPHAATVSDLFERWERDGSALHAPILAQYEIASALTRARVRDFLSTEDVAEALEIVADLGVTFHPPAAGTKIIDTAVELRRHSAYDAAYLALADQLSADLWTLDGPLARNAADRYRVRLID